MRVNGGARCQACDLFKPFSQLLRVTSRLNPRNVHYVCRPGIETNDPNCFRRGTCAYEHHQIDLAQVPSVVVQITGYAQTIAA